MSFLVLDQFGPVLFEKLCRFPLFVVSSILKKTFLRIYNITFLRRQFLVSGTLSPTCPNNACSAMDFLHVSGICLCSAWLSYHLSSLWYPPRSVILALSPTDFAPTTTTLPLWLANPKWSWSQLYVVSPRKPRSPSALRWRCLLQTECLAEMSQTNLPMQWFHCQSWSWKLIHSAHGSPSFLACTSTQRPFHQSGKWCQWPLNLLLLQLLHILFFLLLLHRHLFESRSKCPLSLTFWALN